MRHIRAQRKLPRCLWPRPLEPTTSRTFIRSCESFAARLFAVGKPLGAFSRVITPAWPTPISGPTDHNAERRPAAHQRLSIAGKPKKEIILASYGKFSCTWDPEPSYGSAEAKYVRFNFHPQSGLERLENVLCSRSKDRTREVILSGENILEGIIRQRPPCTMRNYAENTCAMPRSTSKAARLRKIRVLRAASAFEIFRRGTISCKGGP
jgi:hypothetical protein